MNFRNLAVYRIKDLRLTGADLEDLLSKRPLQPCGGLSTTSRGFVSPRDHQEIVYSTGLQSLIALGVYTKKLPASAIKQEVKKLTDSLEKQQGFKPGRKQVRELKERVILEMLPNVVATYRTTRAFIDCANGWLVVDTASVGRAEELCELLRNAVGDLPLTLPNTKLSPATLMEAWLRVSHSNNGFALGDECELRGISAERETIKYSRSELELDARAQIAKGGMKVRKLAVSWSNRVEFVFTDTMQLKRFAYVDIDRQQAESKADNAEMQFEADFEIFAGTLKELLPALISSLGGFEE